MKLSENEKKILDALKKAPPRGLFIKELAIKTQLHRNTVGKYVAILEAKGKITVEMISNAKLHNLKKVM